MNYRPKDDHRKRTAGKKSQWTINEEEERSCFDLAAAQSWTWRDSYWGVHVPDGVAQYLGISQAPERKPVFIARFLPGKYWHGYPVAHWRSPFDKPSTDILEAWWEKGYIRKKTVKRVAGGKRCKP